MKYIQLALLALLTPLATLHVAATEMPVYKPNVIIVLTDDQGYGDVSALNPEAKFKTPNLDQDTLIVYTSDNGPEKSWPERLKQYGHDSRGALKEGKRSVYEGGHRVPFMVRWPQGIKEPGRRWNKPVGQVDLLATFADLLGAKLPETAGEDSQSFAQVLLDPKADYERLPLITHGNGTPDYRYAVAEGDWKLILPAAKGRQGELYNLSTDRAETKNVASVYPEKVAQLEARISGIVAKGRTTPGAVQANDTGYWNDLVWMTAEQYNNQAK